MMLRNSLQSLGPGRILWYDPNYGKVSHTEGVQRLRVFENRVLRRIFGSKGDKATGKWRRLHNGELNDLYSSPNIIRVIKWRRMRWAGHVAHMGEKRGAYRILVGRPEGRRPLGRPTRR
jgi:hypothetical protein